MRRECEGTGRTVEEAIADGCLKLGVEQGDAQFEIIDLPKKGFLGLKNTPAKVLVYMETDEPEVKPQPKSDLPKQQEKPTPKAEKPAAASEPKKEMAQKREDRPILPPGQRARTADGRLKADVAVSYLQSVLAAMDLHSVAVEVEENEGVAVLRLSGEGLGVIIGRRGETLDSLQYLTGLVANRLDGDYLRITIDSGNYREKREKTLEGLARKLASNAVRSGRSSTLEPMNPYERRIIHATVANIEGATSTSVGEEPNRRVVISSTNPRRGGDRGRGPGGNRSGGNNRGRNDRGGRGDYNKGGRPPRSGDRYSDRKPQQSAPTSSEPRTNVPSEAAGKPLYGKIDLE